MKLMLAFVAAGMAAAQAPPSSTFSDVAARAAAARQGNRVEEAISLYRQAVRLRPTWDEGWWYLGTLSYESGRCAEAQPAFRRVTEIRPRGGAGWAMLGLCEFALKDYDTALDHLAQAEQLGDITDAKLLEVVRYHASLLLLRLGEFEQALVQLAPFAEVGNRSEKVLLATGLGVLRMPLLPTQAPPEKRDLLRKAGEAGWAANARSPEAKALYETLVAAYPREPNVHYARGVYLLPFDRDAALEELTEELKISPEHVWARLRIAYVYLENGEPERALPYAERAVSLAPDAFVSRLALGRVLLRLGQWDKSIPELQAAVKLAPERMEARYALIQAYTKGGRVAEAERERRRLVASPGAKLPPQ